MLPALPLRLGRDCGLAWGKVHHLMVPDASSNPRVAQVAWESGAWDADTAHVLRRR